RLPKSEEEVAQIPGASAQQIKRVAPLVVEAVKAGLGGQPLGKPRHQGRQRNGKPGAPPPPAGGERHERPRAWRKRRAAARGVEVQVIAPNAVLLAVATRAPADLDALAAVEGMDEFRVRSYGPEMLQALAAQSGAQGPSRA